MTIYHNIIIIYYKGHGGMVHESWITIIAAGEIE